MHPESWVAEVLDFKITQMPDSVFIKFSSKNADILENGELGGRNYRMKNKIIIYVIVQFLLILCSIFVIPNVEGVLSIFTVLIVIVGNVLNLIFLYNLKFL